ncbi:MIT domain-containing protein 1-like [Tropilaelaps mercedesae]|uniref:MIT domain-containing protein 1-like n=1 Tax=Tropilaelaps mercedesae TaxID=418985 RepID=A0A1V9Y075_9ACAR|nr:MIT domain-containing protein 1-like [Tropilaelaps mercedesae]
MASEKLISVESSAVSVLKRAVEYDTQAKLTSALICYQEGIQLLSRFD